MTVRRTVKSVSSSESWKVRTFEEFLFQFCLCDFDFNSLVDLFSMSALVICIILDGRWEQGVYECRLSQSWFTSNLKSQLLSLTIGLVCTIIVNAAPLFATILCRWFGRLAIPIGDADSLVAGAILWVIVCTVWWTLLRSWDVVQQWDSDRNLDFNSQSFTQLCFRPVFRGS